MSKIAPPNTERQDPLLTLALLAGEKNPSDGILKMEAQGQRALVNSDTLPSDCSPEDKVILGARGVVFGEQVPNDPLFVFVTPPAGWTKRRTEHSMWSELLDQDGKVVATMFYKAAFYDRRAFMNVVRTQEPEATNA